MRPGAARAGYLPPETPRHRQPIWDGSPLAGRPVLVRGYHGPGDTLRFVRFAPRVAATASEVTGWVQPGLIPLLRTVRGTGRLMPLHDGTPEVEYDVDAEVMELSRVFRVSAPERAFPVPYPGVAPEALPASDPVFVGGAWRAGDGDPRWSIPEPLLPRPERVAEHVTRMARGARTRSPAVAGSRAGRGAATRIGVLFGS